MSLVHRLTFGLSVCWILTSCAGGSPESLPSGSEPVVAVEAAITQACNLNTLGLPCDPDGTAALVECQGVCAINTAGIAACVRISSMGLANLDGRVCGSSDGVGNQACARYCQGNSCLAVNAPAGAGCRPSLTANACDGQCNGLGICEPIADPCEVGRDSQLCTFQSCDLANATVCKPAQNLLNRTPCSDLNACTLGVCNAQGACVAGPTKGCDDGNTCTNDACDDTNGACVATPNDSNTCTDSNACTQGDSCAGGRCVGVALVCNDSSACTRDTCNTATGCVYTPKNCSDNNACTDDSCNALNGVCSHTTTNCDDSDPCTTDSCNGQTGCVHTALCNDSNACTVDSCAAGVCAYAARVCDDGNACTTDSCATTGCVATAIEGCVTTGEGGSSGQGGGSDGGADDGGSNQGGAPQAGTGGTSGGTENGGSTAGGTSGGSENGGTTSGGSENGGSENGGSENGGSENGGTNAGASALGGSENGGSAGAPTSGRGGSSGEAGSESEAGASGSAGSGPVVLDDDGGCGCRLPGEPAKPAWPALFGAALAGLTVLRRRPRQAATLTSSKRSALHRRS